MQSTHVTLHAAAPSGQPHLSILIARAVAWGIVTIALGLVFSTVALAQLEAGLTRWGF